MTAQPATPDPLAFHLYCPACGQRLTGRKCKHICQRCGYFESCADL